MSAVPPDAIRQIREAAMRDVMVMVNRLQTTMAVDFSGDQGAYRVGHRHARMQVYDEIDRWIAREAADAVTQAKGG